MKQLTTRITWSGIGAPTGSIERSVFAKEVKELFEQKGYTFEKTKGVSVRGKGSAGWHIYNTPLPLLVDAPPPSMEVTVAPAAASTSYCKRARGDVSSDED